MSMGTGARPQTRAHPWGFIRREILLALKHSSGPCTSAEVMGWCAGAGIDRNSCRRNLCALVSAGVIRNVGTRQRALYVTEGR
jgi:hypothetical protein